MNVTKQDTMPASWWC